MARGSFQQANAGSTETLEVPYTSPDRSGRHQDGAHDCPSREIQKAVSRNPKVLAGLREKAQRFALVAFPARRRSCENKRHCRCRGCCRRSPKTCVERWTHRYRGSRRPCNRVQGRCIAISHSGRIPETSPSNRGWVSRLDNGTRNISTRTLYGGSYRRVHAGANLTIRDGNLEHRTASRGVNCKQPPVPARMNWAERTSEPARQAPQRTGQDPG